MDYNLDYLHVWRRNVIVAAGQDKVTSIVVVSELLLFLTIIITDV